MTRAVLIVDDDAAVREALAQTVSLNDLEPRAVSSFIEAKDVIARDFDGVVLSDIRMPGRDGFHLLAHARAVDPDLPVILLTGEGDIPMAVRATREGAFDFLEKPCAPEDMMAVLGRALKTRALVLENRRLRREMEAGDPAARLIFGVSPQAEALRARVRAAGKVGADVLVHGAAGTGISKVAEVIHLGSDRARARFLKRGAEGLDRAALSAALAEAGQGTLFLDEVRHLPGDSQLALADALEEGGPRLIAGSTADLEAEVAQGRFSADLYYRLSALTVRIPALSERPEDIPVLFRRYVAQAAEQAGVIAPEITPEVVAGLMARDWPGNARALMSEAMRFALGIEGGPDAAGPGLNAQMAQVERALLAQALRRAGGRAAAAAEALQLPRKTFYDKLSRYGLKPEEFR